MNLVDEAQAWIDQDPDPITREQLERIVRDARQGITGAYATLEELFSGHLTFGTAGLRAELGPGPMRMNRVVVGHAAYGLGTYLLRRTTEHVPPSAVIGFDARTNSDVFASDTAEILSGMGIDVRLVGHPIPTPVLAFAVRNLDVDAGVMVTASHNPPSDNGFKVFLGGTDDGSQIIPPADREIMTEITESFSRQSLPSLPRNSDNVTLVDTSIVDAYVEKTAAYFSDISAQNARSLRLCYTPLHGVGQDVFLTLLTRLGFDDPVLVDAQADPNPLFPTVKIPNPEEPGTLDLAISTARENNCDLIIAHDPDADRLAVAVPKPDAPGDWIVLTGNQVGVLLMADIAESASVAGLGGTIACSLVSTPLTSSIAEKNGLNFLATPTGFKWISRPRDLIGGFEEALGYLVDPGVVRDKDGISAGCAVLFLAHRLATQEKTLLDRLADIAKSYGGFASDSVTVRCASHPEVASLMAKLRSNPTEMGSTLDALRMVDGATTPPAGFPPSNLIIFELPNTERVIIRPSGTEPKLKIYIDALAPSTSDATHRVAVLKSEIKAKFAELTGNTERGSSTP